MEVTSSFKEKVREVWGKPKRVADVALNELFNHGDEIGLDHDDQVDHAMEVGLLVGELKDGDLEIFIQRFEEEVLNGK